MSDKTKAYFDRMDTPPLDLDGVDLGSTPKKLWCECTADIHPRIMSRTFSSDVPSRTCPRCKAQLLRDWEKQKKRQINFQAEARLDALARAAKPISHIAHRQKERGE